MKTFSKSSQFLIRNIDVLLDLEGTINTLLKEMGEFLVSIKKDLKKQKWWSDDWIFEETRNREEVYISKASWKLDDAYLVRTGVEYFIPGCVFGADQPAQQYVWVLGKHPGFAKQLHRSLSKAKNEILGEFTKGSGGYVVKKPLTQYLDHDFSKFDEQVHHEILEFFNFWAVTLTENEDVILKYLSENK